MAAVLFVSLGSGVLHESRRVQAVDCDLAFQDYLNADNTYEIARYSYFYDVPTSCAEECNGSSDPNCIANCGIARQTALGDAQIALFSLAQDTCTPFTLDQCAQARGMVDACAAQWAYESQTYTDPEEISAAAQRYMACWEASKIDTCQ